MESTAWRWVDSCVGTAFRKVRTANFLVSRLSRLANFQPTPWILASLDLLEPAQMAMAKSLASVRPVKGLILLCVSSTSFAWRS